MSYLPLFPSFSQRAFAYFIDVILISLPYGMYVASQSNPNPQIQMIIVSIVMFLYNGICVRIWNQTLGQKILKLKVIKKFDPAMMDLSNQKTLSYVTLSWKDAFIHGFGKIIYIVGLDLLLGIFSYSDSQPKARYFQRFAQTWTIKLE